MKPFKYVKIVQGLGGMHHIVTWPAERGIRQSIAVNTMVLHIGTRSLSEVYKTSVRTALHS